MHSEVHVNLRTKFGKDPLRNRDVVKDKHLNELSLLYILPIYNEITPFSTDLFEIS